jgi:uncharacterized protein (TIGR03435 family)
MKLATLLVLATCVQVSGFSQSISKPQFEVASVRLVATAESRAVPQPSGGWMATGLGTMHEAPDRITYQGVTLKAMLMKAYGLKPYQISGPAWIENERYDVAATIPEAASSKEIPEMLRNLLLERFCITAHFEMKEQRVYLLHVEKGGPKLKASSDYHPRSMGGYTIDRTGQAQIKLMGNTMTEFADHISIQLDCPVIDETGIPGKFDIAMPVDAEDLQAGADSLPSSLITAVRSLGLKLEPGKAPVEHLIIDKAQKIPLEN